MIDSNDTLASRFMDCETVEDSNITEFESDSSSDYWVYDHVSLSLTKNTEKSIRVPLYKMPLDGCDHATIAFMSLLRSACQAPKRMDGEISDILNSICEAHIELYAILMSFAHLPIIEKIDCVSRSYANSIYNVYDYDHNNICYSLILARNYPENCIDGVMDRSLATMFQNEDDQFGFYTNIDPNENDPNCQFIIPFDLAQKRIDCLYCNNSREGQVWDLNARMMVTVPDGCPRCGKSPV